MVMKRIVFLSLLAGLVASQNALAATIQTLLGSNVGTNTHRVSGVYFNLTVGPRDIIINRLNVPVSTLSVPILNHPGAGNEPRPQIAYSQASGRAFSGLRLYTRKGSAFGNELSSDGWALRTSGSGVANSDPEKLSSITLEKPVTLKANTTYGIALGYANRSQRDPDFFVSRIKSKTFEDAPGKETYKNNDLTLKFGSSLSRQSLFKNGVCAGDECSLQTNRVWHVQLNYTVVPVPAAGWLFVSALGGLLALRRNKTKTAPAARLS